VRLRSRIVERPVEESLRLREEHIRVERNKVDRAASATDLDNFEEGTIEVTQRSEVPVVSKEARVVEEVSLGKEVEHREETVRDTVRKTEIDVEEFDKDRTRKDL
jgi:stress response protein YsnF